MSKEAIIFEVSDTSFDKYVIANSNKAPVFVAFITSWSEPCVRLCSLFENLAIEFPEQLVFAKADIDENEDLKQRYAIENVPTLKIFIDGQVIRSEEGLLEEADARLLLKDLDIFDESEELRLQARTLHMQGATPEAIMKLSQAMKLNPSNVRVAMDMIQIFIDLGEIDQAVNLFNRIPDTDKNSATGQSLSGQLWIIDQAARTSGLQSLNESLLADPDNFDARFDCAICEIAEHNYQQALDHLLYIQQHRSEYREGAARELILTLINTISPNNPELAKQYRSQLGAILDI